jgi:hypothetical protein
MDSKILHYDPHSETAIEIHRDKHRFRVLDCGRRYGKTYLEMAEAWQMTLDVIKQGRRSRGWVVAPTYNLAMEEWRAAEIQWRDLIPKDGLKRSEKRIIFFDGSEVEFKSADSKDETLRGAGLDWVVMAEASRIPRIAWEQGIRPSLADKQGRAIFGSTPKGRNLFFEHYTMGQDPANKEWKSWKLPTKMNPKFPMEEWEALRATMPMLKFQQEMEAEFLEDGAGIFRGVERCIGGAFEDPIAGERYVAGADWARTEDFSVLTVIRIRTKQVVYFARFNQLDWPFQKQKAMAMCKAYNNCPLYLDSTGLGDPIEHDLRRAGVHTIGYKFTNESKKQLVEWLSVLIEHQWIKYPRIEKLIEELQAYEYEILPSGNVRYQAPEGSINGEPIHDDCVCSLALACQGLKYEIYKKEPEKKEADLSGLPMNARIFWENQRLEEARAKRPEQEAILEDVTV